MRDNLEGKVKVHPEQARPRVGIQV